MIWTFATRCQVGNIYFLLSKLLIRDVNLSLLVLIFITRCRYILYVMWTYHLVVSKDSNVFSELKMFLWYGSINDDGWSNPVHLTRKNLMFLAIALNFSHWNIQLLTGFEDNSKFVWPENGSEGNRSVRGSNKTAFVPEASP